MRVSQDPGDPAGGAVPGGQPACCPALPQAPVGQGRPSWATRDREEIWAFAPARAGSVAPWSAGGGERPGTKPHGHVIVLSSRRERVGRRTAPQPCRLPARGNGRPAWPPGPPLAFLPRRSSAAAAGDQARIAFEVVRRFLGGEPAVIHRRTRPSEDVSLLEGLAGLATMTLVLVVFFLIRGSFTARGGVDLVGPETTTVENREDPIVIRVSASGTVHFN